MFDTILLVAVFAGVFLCIGLVIGAKLQPTVINLHILNVQKEDMEYEE